MFEKLRLNMSLISFDLETGRHR